MCWADGDSGFLKALQSFVAEKNQIGRIFHFIRVLQVYICLKKKSEVFFFIIY